MASSHSGTHLAVGGDKSEVSILEVDSGWKTVMSIELKGLVPLSAKWHPKDQYLALTGQDNSILAIETTNARHVQGHYLKSISPILAVEFSPDGRMAVIGNEAGVITFYALSGTTFVTKYELVLSKSSHLSIEWSPNGAFILIGTCDALIVVDRNLGDRTQLPSNIPPGSSGFSIRKVIRDYGAVHTVSIDLLSQYIAISSDKTRILDAADEFRLVREWSARKTVLANAWSPDGRWMATIGQGQTLTIYDTRHASVRNWRVIFTLQVPHKGLALAWGPMIVDGLLYLAYGGDDRKVTIMEIRTNEETWETVLEVPRDDVVQDLDWTRHGLLAAAIGNGTVSIIDLAYLQSGWAVNEMDYNWQRQALTCFTEIRRNQGDNSMKIVRWLPSPAGSDSLLAIGGTDGALEIIDLTERQHCRGFARTDI
jgi:WD40 repeat protein